jgi:hypothetical protein
VASWHVSSQLLYYCTALHTAHGRLRVLQVLLMTLQGPAPQLDDQPGRPHFSKVCCGIITSPGLTLPAHVIWPESVGSMRFLVSRVGLPLLGLLQMTSLP